MQISNMLLDLISNAVGGMTFVIVLVSLLFLVAGFVMLIKGADMFVDGASKVAQKLKVPLIVTFALLMLTLEALRTAPSATVSEPPFWPATRSSVPGKFTLPRIVAGYSIVRAPARLAGRFPIPAVILVKSVSLFA